MGYEYENLWDAMKTSHYKRTSEQLTLSIQNAQDMHEAMVESLNKVVESIHAVAGTFWFYDRFGDNRIHPEAIYGGSDLLDISLAPGEGVAGKVIESGESTFIVNCQRDERWAGKVDEKTGFVTKSMICVPLVVEELCFGCIQIINKNDGLPFDRTDLEFAEKLAEVAAIMLAEQDLLRGYMVFAGRQQSDTITFESVVYAPTKNEMERILKRTNCYHLLNKKERADVMKLTEELRLIFDEALSRGEFDDEEEEPRGFFGLFRR